VTEGFAIGYFIRCLQPWYRWDPDDGRLYGWVMPDRWEDYLPFTALRFPG
jgi:hypothetical protein